MRASFATGLHSYCTARDHTWVCTCRRKDRPGTGQGRARCESIYLPPPLAPPSLPLLPPSLPPPPFSPLSLKTQCSFLQCFIISSTFDTGISIPRVAAVANTGLSQPFEVRICWATSVSRPDIPRVACTCFLCRVIVAIRRTAGIGSGSQLGLGRAIALLAIIQRIWHTRGACRQNRLQSLLIKISTPSCQCDGILDVFSPSKKNRGILLLTCACAGPPCRQVNQSSGYGPKFPDVLLCSSSESQYLFLWQVSGNQPHEC